MSRAKPGVWWVPNSRENRSRHDGPHDGVAAFAALLPAEAAAIAAIRTAAAAKIFFLFPAVKLKA
jgi:hypothetical protein